MRVFIEIDQALVTTLMAWAQADKRSVRQQVEWIVERVLQEEAQPRGETPPGLASNGRRAREAEYAASGK